VGLVTAAPAIAIVARAATIAAHGGTTGPRATAIAARAATIGRSAIAARGPMPAPAMRHRPSARPWRPAAPRPRSARPVRIANPALTRGLTAAPAARTADRAPIDQIELPVRVARGHRH
jgi:hypothetical protein